MSLLLGNSRVRPKAVLGRQETKREENGEAIERASISEFPSGWGTHASSLLGFIYHCDLKEEK